MLAIFSFLLILSLSLLVIRVASVALVHTGLGREVARFQARSAFSGAGYTTTEAEMIVGHPVRRRIVAWLMVAGNVGLVTAMSSLVVSVIGVDGGEDWRRMMFLAVGAVGLLLIASSAWVDQRLSRLISWAIGHFTDFDARDYARLLHLRKDYGVTELVVRDSDWLCGRTVGESGLHREGTLVLGIECPGGKFIGTPPPETPIRAADTLILYGRTPRIAELDRRCTGPDGDDRHAEATQEQAQLSREERAEANRL